MDKVFKDSNDFKDIRDIKVFKDPNVPNDLKAPILPLSEKDYATRPAFVPCSLACPPAANRTTKQNTTV